MNSIARYSTTLSIVAAAAGPARGQLSNPVVAAKEARLFATDGQTTDTLGASIALSGDTVVSGAPSHDPPGQSNAGAAWVFVTSGVTWAQQAKLLASDGLASDDFGRAVAIDGDTIVVGAPLDDHPGIGNGGSAYVFVRSGTSWSQQAKLVGSGVSATDAFGTSVAIDGDTIVVGSPADELGTTPTTGVAYVFTRSGTVWTEQGILAAADRSPGDRLGESVAIDGDTAAVGAQLGNGPMADCGSAYVFLRTGTAWSEQGKLLAGNAQVSAWFGASIGVSGDSVIVGAPLQDGAAVDTGSAYVFVRSGTVWTQQSALVPVGLTVASNCGNAVALEGDFALVGALDQPFFGLTAAGSAYLFRRGGATWTLETRVVHDRVRGEFGTSVGLSGDIVVAGAPIDSIGLLSGQGCAYAFRLTNTPEIYCTAKTNSLGCTPSIGSSGVPSASSASPFLVTCTNVLNNKNGILFYGFTMDNNAFQGGWLCAAPPTIRTPLQNSAGNPPPDDCSGTFSIDFNARIQSAVDASLVVGADVYGQYWSRDPALGTSSPTSLSNAIHFAIQP